MSKSYFNLFQPSIVKSTELEDIPEELRGKYFVNLNIVSIKWFVNNFLLIEDGNGGYMYMMTNDAHKIRLNEDFSEIIDIPRAYIVLTDEFVASQDNFSTWILSAIADNSYFATGTEEFKPGKDYYINSTLDKYLSDNETATYEASGISGYVLNNYLSADFKITKWWEDLSDTKARTTDFMWLLNQNKVRDMGWTEEDMKLILHIFFSIINDCTSITQEDMLKVTNQIYKKVINYMRDNKTDCATVSMQLILNTLTPSSVEIGTYNCGCGPSSANSIIDGINTDTCTGKYQAAMEEWMQTMLGDKEFYKDWMYITSDNGQDIYPDTGLIDMLISLLEAFLASGRHITSDEKSIYGSNCHCDGIKADNEAKARQTILNYIKLLGWAKDGCLDDNTNKIKVIGKEFAKVISRLAINIK